MFGADRWVVSSLLLGAVVGVIGCSSSSSNTDTTPGDAAVEGTAPDAGVADSAADAAPTDAGATEDAAPTDAIVDSVESDGNDAILADGGVAAYPAQPPAGKIYWGAAIGGNGDPVVRHEQPAGHTLVIRRTFFQWDHRTGYLINIAGDDVANGRLPWVSIKPPSWDEVAAGQHDAEIDQLLNALDALQGPVWLTVHHEPEGGGGVNQPDDPAGPAGHLAMNQRVRQRMTALGTDNVALALILMSWTWNTASGRDPDQWWGPGVYDILGVDHYRDAEASLLTPTWDKVRTWAASKGVEVAVGEWGMRGTDAAAGARVVAWYDAAAASHNDGKGARVVGLCAFDSGLNSPTGSWELKGEQLTAFHDLLNDPRTTEWTSLP